MIETIYRCPHCKSEYPTLGQAEACKDIPVWPAGTKYVGRGAYNIREELFVYGGGSKTSAGKCTELSSLSRHKSFKQAAHGSGIALINEKKAHTTEYACQLHPVTLKEASAALAHLLADERSYKRSMETARKRAEVMREVVMSLTVIAEVEA